MFRKDHEAGLEDKTSSATLAGDAVDRVWWATERRPAEESVLLFRKEKSLLSSFGVRD